MKKKIWRDYWNIWKLRYIKRAYKENANFTAIWMPLYILVVWPALMGGGNMAWHKNEWVLYYCYIIPVLLEAYTAKMLPFGLPKVAYLVPVSVADRKKYLRGMYGMKVSVPLIISFLVMLAAALFSCIRIEELIVGILLQLLVALVVQLTVEYLPEEQRRGKLAKAAGWTAFTTVSGYIVSILAAVCIHGTDGSMGRFGGLPVLLIFLWQVPFTIKCMTFYHPLVENGMFYENVVKKTEKSKDGKKI